MVDEIEELRAENERLKEALAKQHVAVSYTLDRIQADADLHYQAGWGTEVFRRLCVAEAAALGKPLEQVEKARRVTLHREPRRYLKAAEWEERTADAVEKLGGQ
jgi:hypothetical protein